MTMPAATARRPAAADMAVRPAPEVLLGVADAAEPEMLPLAAATRADEAIDPDATSEGTVAVDAGFEDGL